MSFTASYECDLAIPFAVKHGYPAELVSSASRTRRSARATKPTAILTGSAAARRASIPIGDQRLSTRPAPRRIYRAAAPDLDMRVVAAPDEYFRAGRLVAQSRRPQNIPDRVAEDGGQLRSGCKRMWESLRTVRVYLWRYRAGLALGLGALVLKDVAGAVQPLVIRAAHRHAFARVRDRRDCCASPRCWWGWRRSRDSSSTGCA